MRHALSSLFDPGCVKTCTVQKSLESYSHTPPVHDLLDTLYQERMTYAARQKCGNYGVFEFPGVRHRWASQRESRARRQEHLAS